MYGWNEHVDTKQRGGGGESERFSRSARAQVYVQIVIRRANPNSIADT